MWRGLLLTPSWDIGVESLCGRSCVVEELGTLCKCGFQAEVRQAEVFIAAEATRGLAACFLPSPFIVGMQWHLWD